MKTAFMVTLVALSASIGTAFAAPPPGQVIQVFGCELAEGQTADNVWALMDALKDNAADTPDPAFGMFVWTPYRGATPYDFVFGVIASDLNTMAAGSSTYASSPGAAAIGQRFQAFDGCVSAIMMADQVADGGIGMTGGDRGIDAVVETFSCDIREGSDMDDVDDAIEYWQAQVKEIGGGLDAYRAYTWTPLRGGTGSDFVWVGNYTDLASWAKGTSDYVNSDRGAAADARFDEVSSCTNQMWNGYWLITPDEF